MDNNILAIAPNLAQPRFPEVPSTVVEEWAGETWPAGDWHMDRVTVHGMDRILRALGKGHSVTFVAVPTGPATLEVRDAMPTRGHGLPLYMEQYPAKGARGPQAQYTEHGHAQALKGFIVSRALLAGDRCFKVAPVLGGSMYMVLG